MVGVWSKRRVSVMPETGGDGERNTQSGAAACESQFEDRP